ncbi:hypothetical protein L2E82_13271 [Cichorium intybus]|uniref:Uncharacterized protein n=1 Tax=Cichorium intybus TaxID=13427 RepID=A0ACB9GJN0_CICIN|nr:hypothetical protein L2E82_13271 [Cichorium intybus]
MSRGSSSNGNDNSIVKFTNMQISSHDDDDEDEEQSPVGLGFVEKPEHEWSLLRHLFPSKAGGTPAWLDPINLPSGKSCLCDICGEPLRFLLQAYAPLSDKESTFHRTLFVFICPSMSCLLQDQHEQWKRHPEKGSRSIKVFRSQLPRNNQFYSSEAPKNNGSDKPLGTSAPLCSLCVTWKGDKICSNCKKARYCSKMHQTIHWSSAHKSQCRSLEESGEDMIPKAGSNVTWPEYEIINEDESEFDMEVSNSNEDAKDLLTNYDPEFDVEMPELRKALLTDNEDEGEAKSWASFSKRIARAPDQVLRYSRHVNSEPLWPMLSGRPSKHEIPKCTSCGSNRAFEFQILPQLLYYMDVKNDSNSLDWATIVVYTCEASCDGSLAYQEEFAWVQLSSQSR